MFKLFKYEMIGRAKLMAAVVIGIFLLNTMITYKLGGANLDNSNADLALGLTFLVGFTAAIVAFFNALILFKRDLYSETGYLIYTLPKKAYYIINTKLLAAMVELGVYGILSGIFFIIRLSKVDGQNLNELLTGISRYKLEAVEMVIFTILSIVFTYLLAYFSLALSRGTFGNRRYGEFLAIIIFFVISFLLGRVGVEIEKAFNLGEFTSYLGAPMALLFFIIVQLVLCILAVVGTHFVIEKRIDL